ncbi:MAG: glutathione S-transferase N-terminal domain-containing protein [Deltaproteobacteria bacterium]|jgi:GST-like protein|nr:glutathione S-transferase N-terminal domain-containing protein [Deltaproteobacteria bacterium]MCW8892445.1 glutathione S-transferase N-terminal domain-containing protein [Deltaproteobacteria bacterium]MCW9050020.1 glutathione S-transferase N-terminal domain-containing protein [Deltaproteobacteria bacterium]
MIDLYYWTTPNGHKVTILLEETGLQYNIIPVDIRTGAQFDKDFLKISPNNRIPAMVDQDPAGGGPPLAIFESGAMLIYLAEKTGIFLPLNIPQRFAVLQWLMWQMGGLGPMLGQNHHFSHYAPEPIPYAIDRYLKETDRLYGILDDQLADHEYIAGDYSIADMAIYPWIVPYEKQGQKLDDSPNLRRWFRQLENRPAIMRAYEKGREINSRPTVNQESKTVLFGQGRRTN